MTNEDKYDGYLEGDWQDNTDYHHALCIGDKALYKGKPYYVSDILSVYPFKVYLANVDTLEIEKVVDFADLEVIEE